MASPTRKIRRIRRNKETALGKKRKRAIRRDERAKLAAVAKEIGLATPGQLGQLPGSA